MKYLLKNVFLILSVCAAFAASAQIQQAWVAKYNNGVTNGNHQALKMTLDSSGNVYVMGVSANANTNTGYAVVKYAPNGNQIWAARYDSTNYPIAAPTGFGLDSNKNVVVTGNAVTAQYDANGSLRWTAGYSASALAIDAGQNIYITGVLGNFTTMKLASSGSNVWTTTWTYDGLQNLAQAIAVDSSNGVYVAGSLTQTVGRQNNLVFALAMYDTNGNTIWATNSGGSAIGAPQFEGLIVDKTGSVVVEFNYLAAVGKASGYQTGKYSSDGTLEWYDVNPTASLASMSHSLALDGQGDVFVTGVSVNADYTYGTYKIGPEGNYTWTNLYTTTPSGNSTATFVAVDQGDCVYVTGCSANASTGNDIVTIKYDSNGNQVWLQRYDGPGHGNDSGNAISVDNSGNVYVAGYETETNGFTSMILIKYSPVALQKQSNGSVILHAYGSPGETFDIQASTNLQTWQDLGDAVADTNGIVSFDDTNAPLFPKRFYYTVPQ